MEMFKNDTSYLDQAVIDSGLHHRFVRKITDSKYATCPHKLCVVVLLGKSLHGNFPCFVADRLWWKCTEPLVPATQKMISTQVVLCITSTAKVLL